MNYKTQHASKEEKDVKYIQSLFFNGPFTRTRKCYAKRKDIALQTWKRFEKRYYGR